MRFLLVIAVLLAPVAAHAAGAPVTVTVTAKGCEPAELRVPAGETTFLIVNKSSRAMEWEILNGVMVVDERENIAPGFKQRMTTTLEPGDYIITCGLLSNPQGKLIVTRPSRAAMASLPEPDALIGPAAEYRVYLFGEAEGLVKAAAALTAVAQSGDKAQVRAAFTAAQNHFERMRPAFADWDAVTTFTDLATGLRTELATDGASADLANKAKRYEGVAKVLQEWIVTAKFTSAAIVKGAALTLTQMGTVDPAVDRKASIEGARKVADLMQPLLAKADRTLDAQLKADFQAADSALGSADPAAADTALKTLAADAAKLIPALGLD